MFFFLPKRYIARRLIRMASEDIGLAEPQALVQVLFERYIYDARFLKLPQKS